jgi:hypothetical protein
MTDDLVKRLRDPRYDGQLMMRASAADRIEQLKEALQFYAEALPDYLHSVDWEWDCGEKRYGSVARAALENKND